jgi:hypothetical protein
VKGTAFKIDVDCDDKGHASTGDEKPSTLDLLDQSLGLFLMATGGMCDLRANSACPFDYSRLQRRSAIAV